MGSTAGAALVQGAAHEAHVERDGLWAKSCTRRWRVRCEIDDEVRSITGGMVLANLDATNGRASFGRSLFETLIFR